MADDLWSDLGYTAPDGQKAPAAPADPDLKALVASKAAQYGIPPDIADRWVHAESSYNPKAKSPKGARGLTQLMPQTAESYGVKDVEDPEQNVDGGAHYLADLKAQFGSWDKALAAYNAGPDAVTKADGVPNIPETQKYVNSILGDKPTGGGDDLWGQLGYDAKAKAPEEEGPVAFTGLQAHASKPDSAAYLQLVKGGMIDKDAPEGSEKNPYGVQPGMTEKNVPPGAYYISGGKLQRAPGGPKESSALAGLGQGVADVATGLSHVMPGTDDSDVKNALIANQMVYGAKYGGDLKSGAGRFTGQLLGAAPLMATGGEAAAPVLKAAGPVGEFLAGRGGQAMANGIPRFLARGASLATAGAGAGAGAAALTASANEEPLGEQVASGAAGGAVGGTLAPPVRGAMRWLGSTARALAEPLTQGGQAKIVNRLVDSFGPVSLDTRPLVPGSEPTLAEAAGNAGLSTLERNARAHPRLAEQFAERKAQNDTARAEFFDKLKGDEDSLQALHDARDAATSGAREAALGGQTQPADIKPVLDTIDEILKGPEGKRSEVVKALSEVRQNLHDATGEPETDAKMLYGVRKSIGDLLSPKASSDKRGAQLAAAELKRVQGVLDNSIQDVAPGFKEYLADYSKLSKPIDEQQFLQSLRLTDKNQNLTLARVQSALDRIDTMRSAKGVNPAKSLAPETLEQLRNLRDDLKRADNISLGKALGSDTQQNIVTGRIAEQGNVPLAAGAVAAMMHHPLVAPAVGVGKLVYGSKNAEVLDKLGNRLLSPQAPSAPIVAAKPPGQIAGAARKLAKPLLPATAGLIANRLVTQ